MSQTQHDDIPAEIDFSKGSRGKFYKPDATFRLPVYLDEKVQNYLTAKADAKGVELAERPRSLFALSVA